MKKAITLIIGMFLTCQFAKSQSSVFWSENFEDSNWTNNWYPNPNIWDIGQPTSGPGSAHSGLSCAATNLSGNYPDNANIQLVKISNLKIPSKSLNPRLRFWHWFAISSGDYCRVQVKTATSGWTNLGNLNVINQGSGVWTVAELDLSAWSDSLVQIAFYLHSDGGYNNTGWYIDDLEIRTGPKSFFNNEGFENGYGDWYVDLGTWQLGSPTSGPISAHSGTNCIATKLSGNYYDNVNSRIISAPCTIPSKNQNPRLRFWHWFAISSGDYCRVQVKTATSGWTNLGNLNVINQGSGVWTVADLDLSAWSDSLVQIAFYLHSDGGYNNAGWYIDDLEIRTGDYNFNNSENFENGYSDWYVDFGTWEIGVPVGCPGNAFSGTKCAGTNLTGNYYDNIDSRLTSPWCTLPTLSQNPVLTFRQWFSISSGDYAKVQIRTKNSSWVDLVSFTTPPSTAWSFYYINLNAYADSTIQLAFYFHADGGYNNCGWYIDDLNINAVPTASIVNSNPVCKNVTETFKSNIGYSGYSWLVVGGSIQGSSTSSSVDVKWTTTGTKTVSLTVTDAIYADTKSLQVIVRPNPSTAIIDSSGATTFCKPASVLLTANTGSGLSYQWKKGSAFINGATDTSFQAKVTGSYKCMLTNNFGCTKLSNRIAVTALAQPTAHISTTDSTTFCLSDSAVLSVDTGLGLTYQWKRGTKIISGATQKNYTAKIAGTYRCEVKNADGCTKSSNIIKIIIPCRQGDISSALSLSIFPNPTTGNVTINFTASKAGSGAVIVTDMTGREVLKKQIDVLEDDNELSIDLTSILKGFYLIKVRTLLGEQATKVIVQ